MRAVILVVSDKEKDTSSTSGMETSRLTSPLLQHRAASVVQPRLEAMEAAYLSKDFETFGKLTMQVAISSQSLHWHTLSILQNRNLLIMHPRSLRTMHHPIH